MSKTALTAALQNVLKLTFVKKDGTTREMTCTQNREFLNANAEKLSYTEPKGSREAKDGYTIVWDLIKEGWRTVNVDSVEILETIPCAEYVK